MDVGRLNTRSSARNRAATSNACNTTPSNSKTTTNTTTLEDFASLMEDSPNSAQIHDLFSTTSRVHFNEEEDDDGIPSMLMAAASGATDVSNTDSVLRLGFGNLNLISSQGNGGHEVVPLYSSSTVGDASQNGPSGSSLLSFSGTSADLRAAIVSNWLTDHYEPQDNISLPRSVLYDHYLEFCNLQNTEPVNSATFGKIIRSVFPSLRTRRLGTRGNSKYHYFGIGLKSDLLGNDQYSAIYSQYSRPPPARPRTSRRSSASNNAASSSLSGHLSGEVHDLTAYGYGAFAPFSSGAATIHVYGASNGSNGSGSSKQLSFDDAYGSFPAPSNMPNTSGTGSSGKRQGSKRSKRAAAVPEFDESEYVDAVTASAASSVSNASAANNSGHQQNGSNSAFRSTTTLSSPNYDDFAHFLEQICTPVHSNVSIHIPFENVQAFSLVYQQHIIDLLRAVSSHEFGVVEGLSEMFWVNFPDEMLSCLACEESLRIVAIADDYLYQVLIHTLIPDVLEPVPIAITQSIRQFAKFLEGILQRTLQPPIPSVIIDLKLDAARRFCQVLRRRTSLSHMTQAVRSILGNAEHTAQMLSDWAHIDFASIHEQSDWILRSKEGMMPWIEASFRSYLQEGVSLHVWSAWIETVAEQCISSEANMTGSLEQACSVVTMRWSFYSAMIMRDLTLRSAASFGSFHLVNLLFSEYLLFWVEKRLDEHRRSVGLAAFWPNQEVTPTVPSPGKETQAPAAPMQETPTHGPHQQAFAFDDFFRKSAVLGPTSSPLPASKNMPTSTLNQSPATKAAQHLQYALDGTKNKENQQQEQQQQPPVDWNV